jgi:hypothetical protein
MDPSAASKSSSPKKGEAAPPTESVQIQPDKDAVCGGSDEGVERFDFEYRQFYHPLPDPTVSEVAEDVDIKNFALSYLKVSLYDDVSLKDVFF